MVNLSARIDNRGIVISETSPRGLGDRTQQLRYVHIVITFLTIDLTLKESMFTAFGKEVESLVERLDGGKQVKVVQAKDLYDRIAKLVNRHQHMKKMYFYF